MTGRNVTENERNSGHHKLPVTEISPKPRQKEIKTKCFGGRFLLREVYGRQIKEIKNLMIVYDSKEKDQTKSVINYHAGFLSLESL